jgi:predicted CopG family antitoxin
MAKGKKWIVTTSGKGSLSDVKKKLTESGFKVDKVLDEIGVITGTSSDDDVERLRKVEGVADVSPDEQVDIGPPDAPIQ